MGALEHLLCYSSFFLRFSFFGFSRDLWLLLLFLRVYQVKKKPNNNIFIGCAYINGFAKMLGMVDG